MSPAHRVCVGCGAPAAFGPWCVACIEEGGNRGVNVLRLGNTAIPFRKPAHVTAEQFQGAINRALGR